jgi:hypothetical protein
MTASSLRARIALRASRRSKSGGTPELSSPQHATRSAVCAFIWIAQSIRAQ